MFKWKVVANLTSSLGYDASCLGNHEFDDGVTDLEAFSSAIQDSYPLLGTIHKITLTKMWDSFFYQTCLGAPYLFVK